MKNNASRKWATITRNTVQTRARQQTKAALLLALAIASLLMAAPLRAEQQPVSAAEQLAAEQRFGIPAQPLADALLAFGQQSGIQITIDGALARNASAPAVRGTMTGEEALTRLLKDSGLGYVVADATTIAVENTGEEEPIPMAPLTVEGALESARSRLSGAAEDAYRLGSVTINVLGEKTLKDTPYSIESYSRALIENKQARSLADITKGDASVGLRVDNLVREDYTLAIRGIETDWTNGQRIDGMQVSVRAADLPLEHLERVDILKGASGFMYGFGRPAGMINYVLKRPTDDPFRSLSAQVMDSGLALAHGDVGGRLGADDRFGYRVNLVHESGDTYINDGESHRNSGSIALDWEITPDLVWRFDALAGKHKRAGGDLGVIPNLNGAANNYTAGKPLAPIDGSRRLAPSSARFNSIHENYGTDISWDFAANWNLTLAYRYSDNGTESFNRPIIFSNFAGNYSLNTYNSASRADSAQSQAVINGAFTTGMIAHELVVGAAYTKVRDFYRYGGGGGSRAIPNVGNLSNPVDVSNPFASAVSYKDADIEYGNNRRRELFISDTLRIGEAWDIILGLRRGNLDEKYGGYDKSAITPTLAAVFRPVAGLSLYGSYIEALEQGATAPSTAANANQVFPPLVSKQYELGAKAEGDDWSASAALFRIQKGLSYTTPDTNVFTQDGEARYQGLELNGKFRLGSQWLVTASAMWLDATNQKTTGGALDGKRMQGVAREQVSLYGEYRVPRIPLTLTAGARYVGKRPVDSNNRFYLGDVTLFDIGARYETQVAGQSLTLRLNVDNLTDEAYWNTGGHGYLQQGAPRIIKLGAQLEF